MSRVVGVVLCVWLLLVGVLVSPSAGQESEPAVSTTTTTTSVVEPVAPATTEPVGSLPLTTEGATSLPPATSTTVVAPAEGATVTSALGTTIVEADGSTSTVPVDGVGDEPAELSGEPVEDVAADEDDSGEPIDGGLLEVVPGRPDGLDPDDPTAPPLDDVGGIDDAGDVVPPAFDPGWSPDASVGVDILTGELNPIDSAVPEVDGLVTVPAPPLGESFVVPASGVVLEVRDVDFERPVFAEREVVVPLQADGSTRVDGLPIVVTPRRTDVNDRGTNGPQQVRVTPAGRELAAALSEVGLVFQVGLSGFGNDAGGSGFVPARGVSPSLGGSSGWSIEIDPAAFEGAPADLLDRLSLRVFSDCDDTGECGISEALVTTRSDDGTIVAEIPTEVLSAVGGPSGRGPQRSTVGGVFEQRSSSFAAMTEDLTVYYGVSSGTGGAQGNYSASALESLVTYQVGLSTGYAESSYQIPVPPAVGPQPTVAFSYSSGAVDGMNTNANNQASQVGLGWSHANPVISRATRSCSSSGTEGDYEHNLCLPVGRHDGFSLSMNGVGGRLVRTSTASTAHPRWAGATYQEYVLENANGWRIWKVENSSLATQTATGHIPDRWGSWWEVTTEDGTLHVFGRNWVIDDIGTSGLPLQRSRTVFSDTSLQSVQFAPAYVPGSGGTAAQGCDGELCNVATAWFLDQVIDTHGNQLVQQYWQEQNYFDANRPGGTSRLVYARSVNLAEQYYGRTFGQNFATGNKFRVHYEYVSRSDVPWDLSCGTSGTCDKNSPSFFTGMRLSWVQTMVIGSSAPVAGRWHFTTSLTNSSDPLDVDKLKLDQIQRVNPSNTGQGLNPVVFAYEMKPNRVNHPSGVPEMNMPRLKTITNEFKGTVTFTYGQPYPPIPGGTSSQPCSAGATPTGGYVRMPCNMFIGYDAYTGGGGFVLWNSYVVTKQTSDPNHGQSHTYEELTFTYQTPPNWRYSGTWGHTEYDSAQCKLGYGCNHWNDYRGHERVRVTDRAGNITEHFFYTGMREDRYSVSNPAQLVSVNSSAPEVHTLDPGLGNRDNVRHFSGRSLGSRQLTSGGTERSRITTLYGVGSATGSWPYSHRDTYLAEYPAAFGMPGGSATGKITTFYNSHSQVYRIVDEGQRWGLGATTADDLSTFYNYAPNTTEWIVGLPYRVTTQTGISGTQQTTGLIGLEWFLYDGAPVHHNPPTQGVLTNQQTQISQGVNRSVTYTHNSNGTVATEKLSLPGADATTSYGYDGFGHVDEIDGPLSGTGDRSTFTTDPRFGVQTVINAPNSLTTQVNLDTYGRTLEVRYPGDSYLSQWFLYTNATTSAPARVRTKSLNQTGEFIWTWEFFDGLGRPIQTQTFGENGAAINVVSTGYDLAGREGWVTQPYEKSSGSAVYQPYTLTSTPRTVWTYDTDGLVRTRVYDGANVVQIDSSTRTQGWQTTSTDPNGNVTVSMVDLDGNLTSVTDANNQTTTYAYNVRGDLVTITDPQGNQIVNTYQDWSTQVTQMTDPDLGTITYTYDEAGRLATQEDARENKIYLSYNVASQPTSMNLNSVTGPQVSAWNYDSTGRLTSTVHNNLVTAGSTAAPVTTAFSYDSRGRVAQRAWTIPGLPGGTQDIDYTYRQMGAIDTITYPDGTVDNYGFNKETEQQVSLTSGGTTIGSGVRYNPAGQVTEIQRGQPDWTSANDAALQTTFSYDFANRISSISTEGLAEEGWMRHSLIRMYRSGLNRNPDPAGWAYWLTEFAQGLPMANIAQAFAYSGEFSTVWANYTDPFDGASHNVSTNAGFVQWLYGHVLNWTPAQRGNAGTWVNRLDTGSWTRGQMLTYFSDHSGARTNPGVGGDDATLPVQTVVAANADIPQELAYTWDDAGNLTRLHETSQGVDQWQCFTYDNLHRLKTGYTRTTSSCSGHQSGGPFPFSVVYNYDSIGNITNASGTHTVSGGYTYGNGNQDNVADAGVHAATAAGPHTYQYDDAGNQTVRSLNNGSYVMNLTYDVLNRLVATSGSGADLTALYDADGNRVKRTLDGVTTYYLGESYELEVAAPVDEDTVGLYGLNSRQFNISNDLTTVGPDVVSAPYGTAGDEPIIGDWDGDGYDDAGVFRPSNRTFYFNGIPAASGTIGSVTFGAVGDIGVVGDWDGDGIDTIAVWRPTTGVWYFRNDFNGGNGEFASPYGTNGDIPITGDWNGDGIDTPGLYRNGTFFLRNDFAGGVAQITMTNVGTSSDKPIVGDWDGDGIDTVGFYRPSNSRYYLKNTNSGSGIDVTTNAWGNGTSPPFAGNFNASIGHDGQQVTINHTLAGVSVGSTINGEFYATASDHLGSTGVTRDEDAHTRVQRYTPYGAVRAASFNSNLPVDESFTGQTTDPGLGLIDYNARHYDPQLGRFIMADPVLDGLNRYAYVHNNPLNATDPTGGICVALFNDNCTSFRDLHPVASQRVANFAAGVVDGVLFGQGDRVLEVVAPKKYDPDSHLYLGGQVSGTVANFWLAPVGGLGTVGGRTLGVSEAYVGASAVDNSLGFLTGRYSPSQAGAQFAFDLVGYLAPRLVTKPLGEVADRVRSLDPYDFVRLLNGQRPVNGVSARDFVAMLHGRPTTADLLQRGGQALDGFFGGVVSWAGSQVASGTDTPPTPAQKGTTRTCRSGSCWE